MSYVRTRDEIGLDWRRATDAEADEWFAWADLPPELADVEPADTIGIPDSQRAALALLMDVSGGAGIASPLEAIACRLGWTAPGEHRLLRQLAMTRVHHWLGGPIDALARRGFVRRLDGGALLVTWSVS